MGIEKIVCSKCGKWLCFGEYKEALAAIDMELGEMEFYNDVSFADFPTCNACRGNIN